MPFDKRECPNGHRLLWQNRQTITGARLGARSDQRRCQNIVGSPSQVIRLSLRLVRVLDFGVCPLLFRTTSVLN